MWFIKATVGGEIEIAGSSIIDSAPRMTQKPAVYINVGGNFAPMKLHHNCAVNVTARCHIVSSIDSSSTIQHRKMFCCSDVLLGGKTFKSEEKDLHLQLNKLDKQTLFIFTRE